MLCARENPCIEIWSRGAWKKARQKNTHVDHVLFLSPKAHHDRAWWGRNVCVYELNFGRRSRTRQTNLKTAAQPVEEAATVSVGRREMGYSVGRACPKPVYLFFALVKITNECTSEHARCDCAG
jgi:hypothetical protein